MELKQLIKFLKINAMTIFASGVILAVIGIAVYYLYPQKYIAVGSLYVERSVEKSNGAFFTYEGYYNQQTALSYTNTVIGFLESTDIRAKALQKLNIPITEQTLRKFGMQTSVKKSGNQLVTLTVKATSPLEANNLWKALSDSTVETTNNLNKSSDPSLQISPISEKPVVREAFRNIWVDAGIGFGLGLIFGVLILSFKEYTKS